MRSSKSYNVPNKKTVLLLLPAALCIKDESKGRGKRAAAKERAVIMHNTQYKAKLDFWDANKKAPSLY